MKLIVALESLQVAKIKMLTDIFEIYEFIELILMLTMGNPYSAKDISGFERMK